MQFIFSWDDLILFPVFCHIVNLCLRMYFSSLFLTCKLKTNSISDSSCIKQYWFLFAHNDSEIILIFLVWFYFIDLLLWVRGIEILVGLGKMLCCIYSASFEGKNFTWQWCYKKENHIYMINLDITKLTVLIQKKRAEVRLYNAYVTQSTSVNLVSHNKP